MSSIEYLPEPYEVIDRPLWWHEKGPCRDEGGDPSDEPQAGWYGRLSAPGYMDCTDWSGPFATSDAALANVMETYEVDENGDEPSDDDDAQNS